MRLWDGTQIVKPTVDRATSEWATLAEDVDRTTAVLVDQVKQALATAPWGGGAEGMAFKAAHFRNDGPDKMLAKCAEISKGIADAGAKVRKAIDNTLQTDADIKRDLAAGLRVEI
ncbi:hypothetical protein [Nonomuraea zeae]|uniref:WXG100 family type VII secretion target n=1 Tax=Nonomuraea zeae TaxID=1642303 RepID=A0A5S4H8H3_9ACTN|nr:hypothetical protein [Nonomuraea zeae]TMR35120.1 hypothetical protein ETD85_14925 [Nonomuraea zeae]